MMKFLIILNFFMYIMNIRKYFTIYCHGIKYAYEIMLRIFCVYIKYVIVTKINFLY
ncbi:MAG: hypothetical protein DMNBKLKJ_00313 [Candidatus Westeberhardia cardiocondylae]|nr:hypothetical protein [Candidatus Westeberhardia cardiocondylae]